MGFTIELENDKRESVEDYRYRICRDGQLVASYWHDSRGDDHGIRFVDGITKSWPVGNLLEFIQGGGSQPVTLTQAAIAYLEKNTAALPGESAPASSPRPAR